MIFEENVLKNFSFKTFENADHKILQSGEKYASGSPLFCYTAFEIRQNAFIKG